MFLARLPSLAIILFFAGCSSDKKKIATQLEDESLRSGVRKDTLIHGYCFGMSRELVYNRSKKLVSENKVEIQLDSSTVFIFETENFKLVAIHDFYYYDGKLFRLRTSFNANRLEAKTDKPAKFTDDIIESIQKMYGDQTHKNGTQHSKYFWLQGNLRVDYFDTLDKVLVYHSDMSVESSVAEKIKRLYPEKLEAGKIEEQESSRESSAQSPSYITNGGFLAAITEAYLDKAYMYVVDSDKKAIDDLVKKKDVLYLEPNLQVELVQESSNVYDKVEFRVKGDRKTFWARREAIGESKSKEISKQQYKELWPFTVDKGTLKCIEIRFPGMTVRAVILEVNGAYYAINGSAKNWAKKNQYIDGDEIWNFAVPIGSIIEDGLNLCE